MTTDALIIRENNNIGESDRFVTALTRELGVIRASAKGAQHQKPQFSRDTATFIFPSLPSPRAGQVHNTGRKAYHGF